MSDAVTAAQRYSTLQSGREPFLRRARDCAALTVPYLMPPAGYGPNTVLDTPYQSLGARGVRTLSSKLLLSLFPTNTPFFRYSIDDQALLTLTKQEGMRGTVEQALAAREKAIMAEMDAAQFQPVAFTCFQQLIVAGNVLLHIPEDGVARAFRLDQYVVKRDASGNLMEIVVEEKVARTALSEDVQAALSGQSGQGATSASEQKDLPIYTRIVWDGKMWQAYQEVEGVKLPGAGQYAPDELPWLALRLSVQPGDDYGRSYVEEYLGDLDSLEGLVEAIVEGSAAGARVVFMVSPNGSTQLRVFSKARTGDVIVGEMNDVGVVQANKAIDLSVARAQAQDLAQSLAFAFMLNTAIQRSGERVTAEEIRYMASELDVALGGVYTLLGTEFQLKAVNLFSLRMEKNRSVPPLPKDLVQPKIVSGLQAIGRGNDQQNLKLFMADVVQTWGPEVVQSRMNIGEFLKRSSAAYSIDPSGLILTDEEVAQQQQIGQLQALVAQLGPEGIKQLGNIVTTQMKQQEPAKAS